MFGFSFTKVVVLVAVVAIIWFGFRWFERWQKETREREEKRAARLGGGGGRVPPGAAPQAEEMTACRVCGTYVAAGSARSCGKPNCPFPR
jgi:uncharacterized protein